MSKGIQIVDLTMRYGSVEAIDHVSLTVETGEMLAVLGPSGCGKSTLLSLISGLRKADEGEIYLDEKRIDHLPAQQRGVGFLFQNYALFPHMSVQDNIGYGLRIKRRSKSEIARRVDELLAIIGMEAHRHKKPRQLSGGEQQRVALARALAPRPDIILLDEPLSALDVKIRQKLRLELKNIQKELGVTTLLVTHDQEEAFELGDRVAVMNCGKVEQIGEPARIYEHPATEFVADFVGEVNRFRGSVRDGKAWLGELALDLPQAHRSLPGGTGLHILVRPENIRLARGGGPAGQLRGQYLSCVFLGAQRRLNIKLADGQLIHVAMTKEQAQALDLKAGEAVALTVADGVIIPGE